ncbi:MAG: hypothetical protein ACREBM_02090 [Sphingomicrobium sp.]
MTRPTRLILAAAAAVTAAAGGWAAQTPKSLAGVAGGMWELSGIPGTRVPTKVCVAAPIELAFVEHAGAGCKHLVLGDSGDLLRISYRCSGAGFGQASIKTITPRSLRVDVQGIAANAPYAYVMQAHRTGDCTTGPRPPRH